MSIDQDTSRGVVAGEQSRAGRSRAGTAAPRRSGGLGLRDEIPKIGLPQYWYPAIADKDVPQRKAVRRKLLGQDIAFFRGKQGQVVAITNWCPHRNASLGDGKSLYPGTLSCPYHGPSTRPGPP
jgi:hypothetical protein